MKGEAEFSRQGTQGVINRIIRLIPNNKIINNKGPTIPVIRVVIHDEPLKGDSNQPCLADWVCTLGFTLFLTKLRLSLITPG